MMTDEEAERKLDECAKLFKSGNYEKVIEICKYIEKKRPDISVLYYYMGMSVSNLGNTDEGLAILDRGLKVDPKFWLLYSAKGLIYYKNGNLKEALKNLIKSIKYNNNNVESLVLAAVCATMLLKPKLVKKYLTQAAKIEIKKTVELWNHFLSSLLSTNIIPQEKKEKIVKARKKLLDEISKIQ